MGKYRPSWLNLDYAPTYNKDQEYGWDYEGYKREVEKPLPVLESPSYSSIGGIKHNNSMPQFDSEDYSDTINKSTRHNNSIPMIDSDTSIPSNKIKSTNYWNGESAVSNKDTKTDNYWTGKEAAIGEAPDAESKEPGWGKVIGNSLASGFEQLGTGILKLLQMNREEQAKTNDWAKEKVFGNDNSPYAKKIKELSDQQSTSMKDESKMYNAGMDYLDKKAANNEDELKDASGVKKVIGGAVESIPQMLPGLIPGGGLGYFGATAGGNYARQAEKEGADIEQQKLYGIAGGALEGLTEMIPFHLVKKTAAGKFINKGAETFLGKYGKQGLAFLGEMASEGIQEGAVDPAVNLAKKEIYAPDMKMTGEGGVFDKSQMTGDAGMGIVLGTMLGALGLPVSYASHRMSSNIIENKIKPTPEMIDLVKNQFQEDLSSFKTPEEMISAIDNGTNDNQTENSPKVDIKKLPEYLKLKQGDKLPTLENTPNNMPLSEMANSEAIGETQTNENSVSQATAPMKINPLKMQNNEVKTDIQENSPVVNDIIDTKEVPTAEEAVKSTDTIPVNSIKVDPQRFQFKSDVDSKTGAGKTISDINKWDDNLAGRITVWKDNNGNTWVVNGHHRLAKANELGVKDIDAKILNESDGISAKDAREIGAKINLAEGRGTATDAAKLFREGNYTTSELKESGLSLKEGLIKNGYNIAQLNDRAFNKIVNKTLSEEQGAIIGESFPSTEKNSEANQNAALDYIAKHDGEVTTHKLKEVIDGIKNSNVSQSQQTTLFGTQTMFNNNFENKADIISNVKRKLSMEKNLFSNLVNNKKAQAALKAGNSLNTEANEKGKLIAEIAAEFIDKDKWYPSTPIGSIFEKYSNLMEAGMSTSKAAEGAFNEVKALIESGNFIKKEEAKEENKQIDGQLDMFGGMDNEEQRQTKTSTEASTGRGTTKESQENQKPTEKETGTGEKETASSTEKVEEATPKIINNRDHITIERVNKEPFTVTRGDKVRVFFGNKTDGTKHYEDMQVIGISQANQTVKIKHIGHENSKGFDIGVAFVYPLETKITEKDINFTNLSEVIDKVNKKNEPKEGFTEADRVPQDKQKPLPVLTYKDTLTNISDFNKNLRRGDISYNEAMKQIDFIKNKPEEIKAVLGKLTVKELQNMASAAYIRDFKKAELIDIIYENQLLNIYYKLTGENSISISYGGKSYGETVKEKLESALNGLTEDKFNKVMENNKAKYKKTVEERNKRIEGTKKPVTLEDFRNARLVRKLTPEEKDTYEDLVAQDKKDRLEAQKERTAERKAAEAQNTVSTGEFTIEKSVHTKKNTDIWIVRPKERLESEAFKTLKGSMSKLGAYYSSFKGVNGFVFDYDPTEVLSGEKQLSEVKTAEPEKKNYEKLQTLAEKDISEDRKNTINNIAEAMKDGKLKLLDNIQYMTQFDTLDSLLRTAQWKRKNAEKIEWDKTRDGYYIRPAITKEDIRHAEIPGEKVYVSTLRDYIKKGLETKGSILVARRLNKLIENIPDKGSFDNTQVELNSKNIEDVKELAKTFGDGYTILEELLQTHSRLEKLGIENNTELRAALREYLTYRQQSIKSKEEVEKEEKIKEYEDLVNHNIPGFFPTPEKLVNRMIEEADIKPSDKVLEPSAGNGAIADRIGVGKVDVAEWNSSLNDYLRYKGHNVIGSDALKIEGKYDKIIMNPPFEKNQDIIHVMNAYNENLKPGGRIVAIMSEHPFFASDKKSQEFRQWLDDVGGTSEKNPEGSFMESARKTGINTRLVIIDKEASPSAETKIDPSKGMNLQQFGEEEYMLEAKKFLEREGRLPNANELMEKFIKENYDNIPKEKRKFIDNSMLNTIPVPTEMKEEFIDHPEWYEYIKSNNEQTMNWARNEIESRFNDTYNRISKLTALKSERDTALAIEIERKFILDGDYERAKNWSLQVAKMGTHTGRAIQYFSVMKRFTAQWTLDKINKQLDNEMEKMRKKTPGKVKEYNEKVDDLTNKMTDENKKAVNDVINKILQGKDINTVLDEAKENINVEEAKVQAKKSKRKFKTNADNSNVEQTKLPVGEAVKEDTPEEVGPEGLLARRIENHMAETKNDPIDPINVMVNTLYNVAKKTLPEKELKKHPGPIEFINEAMQHKEMYKETWDNAKDIVKDYFVSEPDALSALDEYFNQVLDRPFSDKQLTQAVKKAMKSVNVNYNDLALKDYNTINEFAADIKKQLISKGLDADSAKELEHYINNEYYNNVKEAKEKILDSKYGESTNKASSGFNKNPNIIKSPSSIIKELENLGAFNGDTFSDRVKEKVDSVILRTMKDFNIKPSEIIKGSYGDYKKASDLIADTMLNGLKLKNRIKIENYVTKKFSEIIHDTRQAKIENMFIKKSGEVKAPKDILRELSNIGIFNVEKYKEQAGEKLKTLVKRELKDMDIDLTALVKKHYSETEALNETLAERLIDSGMDTENAYILQNYIASSVNSITKEKKEKLLENLFGEKSEKQSKKKKQFYDKIIELSNLGSFTNEKYKDLVAEKMKMPHLSQEAAEHIMELANKAQELPEDSREKMEAHARLIDYMESQIETPILRYINAYQTMAMLLNTKTAARNTFSNLFFGIEDHVKDYLRAGIDTAISAATKNRTATRPELKSKAKGLMEGSKEVYLDLIHNVNTRSFENKTELHSGRVFKKGIMGFADRITRLLLDDRPFQYAKFKDEIRALEKVAWLNGETFNYEEALNEARRAADIVTFNDKNVVSDALITMKKALNGGKEWGFGDVIIKFARTPANIFVRQIEYSPLTFIKAIGTAGYNAAKYHTFEQKVFVDDLAKSITGTAVIGLGVFLFKMGALILSDDDKDRQTLLDAIGAGKFKLNFSAIGRFIRNAAKGDLTPQKLEAGDNLGSYDWAMPFSSNVTLGAAMTKAKTSSDFKGLDILTSYGSALIEGVNNILDQPFLQGISKLTKYDNLAENAGKLLLSVPSSFIPTATNQVRQLTDNYTRETYDDNTKDSIKNQLMNKLPVLSKKLPVKPDVLGRDRETYKDSITGKNNILNVMFNPSNMSKYDPTKASSLELDNNQIPSAAPKYIEYNTDVDGGKKRIDLTQKEYVFYERKLGELTSKAFTKLAGENPPNDKETEKLMGSIITEVNTAIKEKILKDRGLEKQKKGNKIYYTK